MQRGDGQGRLDQVTVKRGVGGKVGPLSTVVKVKLKKRNSGVCGDLDLSLYQQGLARGEVLSVFMPLW